jgi:hypothetical protein
MLVQRESFLHLVCALAVAGCASTNPPQQPVAVPLTSATATPALVTETEPAAPSRVEFIEATIDYPSLPGPTCEASLDIPMPGRDEDHPNVHLGGEFVNRDKLEPARVRASVKRQAPAITACFANESADVQRTVVVLVSEDGSHEVKSADGRDPLQVCLEKAIAGATFDKPSSGNAVIMLPFVYEQRLFTPDPDLKKLRAWEAKINRRCKEKHRTGEN